MKKVLLIFFTLTMAFAYDNDIFYNSKDFDELKKSIYLSSFEDKLKLQILSNLFAGREKQAKEYYEFYKILKTKYENKQKIVENIIYIPKGKYSIVVSKKRQKLSIFTNENGIIKEIYQENCITGKKEGDKLEEGDQRTPNGIYFPTGFIPSNRLSKIYGHGAFPLNYPNIIDKKFFHKTGSGIWLHATNNDNRPPFSSNGCVVVKNNVFDYILNYINFKETPIIIVEDFSFSNADKLEKDKNSLVEFLYEWKKAWENTVKGKNLETYFNFYSDNMISTYGNKAAFVAHKKRVSKNKKWIKIFIENIYISKDGRVLNFGNIYAISFDMEYKSNNYNWKGKKVLYIIRENKKWKILAEESL